MYGPGSSFLFPGCIAAGKLHPKFNNFKSGPYIRQKSTAFLSFFHKQGVRAPKSRPKSSLKPRRSSPPPPPAQKSAQTKAKSTSKKPAHQVFTGAPTLTCTLFLLCACCLFTFFDLFDWLPWGAGLSMSFLVPAVLLRGFTPRPLPPWALPPGWSCEAL